MKVLIEITENGVSSSVVQADTAPQPDAELLARAASQGALSAGAARSQETEEADAPESAPQADEHAAAHGEGSTTSAGRAAAA